MKSIKNPTVDITKSSRNKALKQTSKVPKRLKPRLVDTINLQKHLIIIIIIII